MKISTSSISIRLIVCALVGISSLVIGCSRQGGGAGSETPQTFLNEFRLSKRVPPTAFAAILGSNSSEAAKKYHASPWGKSPSGWSQKIAESLPSDGNNARQQFTQVIKALESAGVMKDGALSSEAVKEYAIVGALDKVRHRVEFGFLAETSSADVSSAVLAKLKEVPGFESTDGGKTLQSTFKARGSDSDATSLYLTHDKEFLFVSTAPALLQQLTNNAETTWHTSMQNDALLADALKKLPRRGAPLSVGLVNLTELVSEFPTQDGSKVRSPFSRLVFSAQMADAAHFVGAVTVDPQELESPWVTSLRSAKRMDSYSMVPGDAVGVVSLQTALFKTLHEAMMPYMGPEQQAKAAPLASALQDVVGATVAVRGARGASPFPELLVAIEAKDAPALQAQLGGMLGALAAGGGLPLSPLQTKQLAGQEVQYLMTPLGVGLFLTAKEGKVLATSSEGFITDVIGGNGKPLSGTLTSTSKGLATKEGQLGSLFIDYTKGVEMVEGLQASLAMFTGGAAQVDSSSLAPFREMGTTTAVVYMDRDAVMTEMVHERPSK